MFTLFENDSKCLIMIFEFCHFLPIFVLLRIDLSGNTVWPHASGSQKLAKHLAFFNEWDFFCDFQTQWWYYKCQLQFWSGLWYHFLKHGAVVGYGGIGYYAPPPPSTPLYAERWWLCYAGLVVNETCNLLSWVALCSTVFCIPFEHFIYIPFPSRHCPARISPLFSYSFTLFKEKFSRCEPSELTTWVNKSSVKMPKMVHFDGFKKT